MDEKTAIKLFKSWGIEATVGDEVYQALVEHHPTVRAFVDGDITFSEALFVEEYLSNGFNASKAARAAKYGAASSGGYSNIGSSVLKRTKIRELVARRIAERALSADEILARYREVAEASIEDFIVEIEDETGLGTIITPSLRKAIEAGKVHLAKELKVNKDGEVTIKLRDQDHALDQLARSVGVFDKDNVVHLPPEILALLDLTPNELAGRDQAYDALENWEDDANSGQGEDSAPDPEES
jgi:phage terminase small subunit